MKKCLAIFIILCFSFNIHAWASEIDKNLPETTKQSLIPPIENEKEIKIGNFFDLHVTETFVILDDEELVKKITQLVEKLVKVSDCHYPKYKIRIINDSSPFTASFPGYFYISTGLLDILENEDELAAMLATAIAHMHEKYQYDSFISEWNEREKAVIAGVAITFVIVIGGGILSAAAAPAAASANPIVLQRWTSTTSLVILPVASILTAPFMERVTRLPEKKVLCNRLGPELSRTGMAEDLAIKSNIFIFLKEMYEGYDSDKELKAVELAIRYLDEAGYNSRALVSALVKLLALRNEYLAKGYISNVLISQPSLEARIEYANKIIKK